MTNNQKKKNPDIVRAYWIEKLSTGMEPSRVRPDFPEHVGKHMLDKNLEFKIQDSNLQRLLTLTGGKQTLLCTALVSVLKICLFHHTRNRNLIIGTPARLDEDGKAPVNAVPILDSIEGNQNFRSILKSARTTLGEAYDHQDLPFADLCRELGLQREGSQNPLFDVALTLEKFHGTMPALGQNLCLNFALVDEVIVAHIRYPSRCFRGDSINRFAGHFAQTLAAVLDNTMEPIGTIEILTGQERKILLETFNDTDTATPHNLCIHQYFENQVAKNPKAIAVDVQGKRLTYDQLNQKANRLAHHLRHQGVTPEVNVGLFVNRGLDLVVGFLAILKAGGVYVPLDPNYPLDRLAYLVEDSAAEVFLTLEPLVDRLPATWARIVTLDAEAEAIGLLSPETPENVTLPENLAYLVYTSGSTGSPKAVMISHGALINFTRDSIEAYELEVGDRMLQFVSPNYDAFVSETYPTLCSGATLVLHPDPTKLTPAELMDQLVEQAITTIHLPPTYLGYMVAQFASQTTPRCTHLKVLVTGGQSFSTENAMRWQCLFDKKPKIVNAYGPSEATVTATDHHVIEVSGTHSPGNLPVGRPVSNTAVYLTNLYLKPVPMNVDGEICIGGLGVCRGYQNRPGLTATKFIPDPFSGRSGARLYKTGDLARLDGQGQLFFLGRFDDQVKLRGYRIELGEIENSLMSHPAVRETIVMVREDQAGREQLVAYYLPEPSLEEAQRPSQRTLRDFLSEKLPHFMLPGTFMSISAWPLSPIGKVDKNALPAIDEAGPTCQYLAPRNQVETQLAGIWAELFEVERVGVLDDFLELGGNSLLAFQMISRVRDTFSIEMNLNTAFQNPTVAELATVVTQALATTNMADPESLAGLLDEIENLPQGN